MENASRALVMAGGMLIAIIILGALVLMFNGLSSYKNQEDSNKKSSQVAEFNYQFEQFNKPEVSLMELRSAINKILSNNARYPEYKINESEDILDFVYLKKYRNTAEYKDLLTLPFQNIEEKYKINVKFGCTKIEYNNPEGRISKILFEIIRDAGGNSNL